MVMAVAGLAAPLVTPFINLLGKAIKGIERGVNSKEHNVKNDVCDSLMQEYGLSQEVRDVIHDVMDDDADEGLGDRLRALIALGVIPQGAIPMIKQMAEKNGVPLTSLDPATLDQPMSLEEAVKLIKPERLKALGLEGLAADIKLQQDRDVEDRKLESSRPQYLPRY